MRKPPNLIYGLEDKPPLGVTLLLGVQHLAVVLIYLIMPLVVAQAAGASPAATGHVMRMAMIALGIGVFLQTLPRGPVGSARGPAPGAVRCAAKTRLPRLCPPVCTAAYLSPALLAAKAGGLPLVFGMTAIAGVFEALLSRLMPRLRVILAPDWGPRTVPAGTGFVVLMIGLSIELLAGKKFLAIDQPHPTMARELLAAGLTLGIMGGLTIWARGPLRLFCALIGMVCGYLASWGLGLIRPDDLARLREAAIVQSPHLGHPGLSFDAALLVPFLIGSLASVLFAIMPEPVIGGGLVFAGSFVIASGLSVLSAQPLDARKTLVIGISIMLGLSRTFFPAIYAHVPEALRPFVQSDLSPPSRKRHLFGRSIAVAVLLTLLFRAGIRRRAAATLTPDATAPKAARDFIETQRGTWSGPRALFDRAGSAAAGALTAMRPPSGPGEPITLKVAFDDLDVDLELSHRGPQPEVPEDRFGADEAQPLSAGDTSQVRLRIRS